MITLTVLVLATLFLAYSNGANDNFKGVATLFGSGTTSYKSAITWATISTFAGSITSLFRILMSWLLTLPIAAIISAVVYAIVVQI